ncbi:hypothetical protein MMPV_003886 [Pyropia vietnamensis]
MGMARNGGGAPSSAVATAAGADADDGARFDGAAYAGRLPPWLVKRVGELGWVTPTAVQRRALDVLLPPATPTVPITTTADDGREDGTDEATAGNGGGRGGGRGGGGGRRGRRSGRRGRGNDGEAWAGGSTTRLGEDAVLHAVTGSGKTLAYLLPALAAVEPRRTAVQALVVVPTQELGMQVYKVARRLASGYGREMAAAAEIVDGADDEASLLDYLEGEEGAPEGVAPAGGGTAAATAAAAAPGEAAGTATPSRPPFSPPAAGRLPVLPMLDQADLRRQKLQLRQTAPRLVIGTPGRLVVLVASGRLCLDRLKVLVVDEFDAVLSDPASTANLQALLATKSRAGGSDRDGGVRQTVFVSATVPQHRHFLRQAVRSRWTRPVVKHVWVGEPGGEDAASGEAQRGGGGGTVRDDDDDDDVGGGKLPSSLRHTYALCEPRKRLGALRQVLVQDLLVDPPRPSDGSTPHTDDVAVAAAAAAASWGAAARGGGSGEGGEGEVENDGSPAPAPPLPGVIVFVMPTRPVDAIVAALNGALPPPPCPTAPPRAAVPPVATEVASSTSAGAPSHVDGAPASSPPSPTPPPQPLVVGLSATSSLHSRRQALAAFRAGTARVLVATDVAARGLDVPHTAAVVHFDLPPDATAYVHRSGRAGRAGRAGVVVSLVAPGEAFVMDRWANVLGLSFERWGALPPAATAGVKSPSEAETDAGKSGAETVIDGMEG